MDGNSKLSSECKIIGEFVFDRCFSVFSGVSVSESLYVIVQYVSNGFCQFAFNDRFHYKGANPN